MKFREFLADTVALKLYSKYNNSKTDYYYRLFKDSVSWSRDEIENYQIEKIRGILKHSYENVLFYKYQFDEVNFDWNNFKYLDDLNRIPPLTRKDIQESNKLLIANNVDLKNISKKSSSGSTGKPIVFYHDADTLGANRAAILFGKYLAGVKPGDKWINIWGNPNTVGKDWKKISAKVSMILANEKRFPAFLLKELDGLKNLLNIINTFSPDYIYGYTSAIYVLAKYLNSENLELKNQIKVLTTAETLHSYQKNEIEKHIGPIFDQYGCREINGVACQTNYNDYYSIIEPRVYLEFGETVENETGIKKILLTDLYNRAFPLIRYEVGDIGTSLNETDYPVSELKFNKIKSIEGRIKDIITLPSGGSIVVPNIISPHLLEEVKGIERYQIVYKKTGILEINLIVSRVFDYNSKDTILEYVKNYLPSDIIVEMVFNKEIIESKTGKFKLFVDLTSTN